MYGFLYAASQSLPFGSKSVRMSLLGFCDLVAFSLRLLATRPASLTFSSRTYIPHHKRDNLEIRGCMGPDNWEPTKIMESTRQ